MSKSKAKVPKYRYLDEKSWKGIGRALRLSPRELEILKLIFDGEIEARIGYRLGISVHTVHEHLRRIYLKTGASDHRELVLLVLDTLSDLEDPA